MTVQRPNRLPARSIRLDCRGANGIFLTSHLLAAGSLDFENSAGPAAAFAISDFFEGVAPGDGEAAGALVDELWIAAFGQAPDRIHADLAQVRAFRKRNDFIEPALALAIGLKIGGRHGALRQCSAIQSTTERRPGNAFRVRRDAFRVRRRARRLAS